MGIDAPSGLDTVQNAAAAVVRVSRCCDIRATATRSSAFRQPTSRSGDIPSVLIHGRLDLSSPLDVPSTLAELWDASELVVIDDAGQTGGPAMTTALMAATDRFANSRR